MASTGQAMILPQTTLTPFPPLPLRIDVKKVNIKERSEEGYQAWPLTLLWGIYLLPKKSQEQVQERQFENLLSRQQKQSLIDQKYKLIF